MPVDLLPVGEELAELDLVVRQLDDGSLTVARDDSLPDEARVRIAGGADGGLLATLAVAPATPQVEAQLAAAQGALSRGRLFVSDGHVRVEAGLPAGQGGRFARDQLSLLFEDVLRGASAVKPRLALEPARQADPNAPTEFVLVEPQASPGVGGPPPVARATGKLAPLPASFLRGAGQHGGPTATQRYGAVGDVPGHAELSPEDRQRDEERRASARQRPQPAGGGGAAGLALAIGGLVIVGGGAAAVLGLSWVRRTAAPPPQVATPAGPTTPTPPAFPDAQTPGGPGTPSGTTMGEGPGSTPPLREPTRPALPGTARSDDVTEAQVLDRVKRPGERAGALDAWVAQGMDRVDGARLRLLQALGAAAEDDAKASRILTQSLRASPPQVDEAIACLPISRGNPRRALIQLLGEPGPDKDRVAAALAALEDTPDLLVEEALVRLGHPKEGAALRLTNARGKEWALWGDGQPMLEGLSKEGVKNVAPLLEHEDAEVRAMACSLIGRAGQPQEALSLLANRLRDDSADVRLRAVEAIVAGGDARAAWPLARGLGREAPGQVRDAMRDALSRMPTRETVNHLGGLFERPDAADRRAAVVAADALGKVEGMPILVKALDDPDRAVRLEGLRALEKAHRAPALRPKVAEGLAAIRRIGLDRSDRELSNIARNLHLAIAGRLPDESVRPR